MKGEEEEEEEADSPKYGDPENDAWYAQAVSKLLAIMTKFEEARQIATSAADVMQIGGAGGPVGTERLSELAVNMVSMVLLLRDHQESRPASDPAEQRRRESQLKRDSEQVLEMLSEALPLIRFTSKGKPPQTLEEIFATARNKWTADEEEADDLSDHMRSLDMAIAAETARLGSAELEINELQSWPQDLIREAQNTAGPNRQEAVLQRAVASSARASNAAREIAALGETAARTNAVTKRAKDWLEEMGKSLDSVFPDAMGLPPGIAIYFLRASDEWDELDARRNNLKLPIQAALEIGNQVTRGYQTFATKAALLESVLAGSPEKEAKARLLLQEALRTQNVANGIQTSVQQSKERAAVAAELVNESIYQYLLAEEALASVVADLAALADETPERAQKNYNNANTAYERGSFLQKQVEESRRELEGAEQAVASRALDIQMHAEETIRFAADALRSSFFLVKMGIDERRAPADITADDAATAASMRESLNEADEFLESVSTIDRAIDAWVLASQEASGGETEMYITMQRLKLLRHKLREGEVVPENQVRDARAEVTRATVDWKQLVAGAEAAKEQARAALSASLFAAVVIRAEKDRVVAHVQALEALSGPLESSLQDIARELSLLAEAPRVFPPNVKLSVRPMRPIDAPPRLSGRDDPARAGPGRVGLGRVGPGRVGPGRAGPGGGAFASAGLKRASPDRGPLGMGTGDIDEDEGDGEQPSASAALPQKRAIQWGRPAPIKRWRQEIKRLIKQERKRREEPIYRFVAVAAAAAGCEMSFLLESPKKLLFEEMDMEDLLAELIRSNSAAAEHLVPKNIQSYGQEDEEDEEARDFTPQSFSLRGFFGATESSPEARAVLKRVYHRLNLYSLAVSDGASMATGGPGKKEKRKMNLLASRAPESDRQTIRKRLNDNWKMMVRLSPIAIGALIRIMGMFGRTAEDALYLVQLNHPVAQLIASALGLYLKQHNATAVGNQIRKYTDSSQTGYMISDISFNNRRATTHEYEWVINLLGVRLGLLAETKAVPGTKGVRFIGNLLNAP